MFDTWKELALIGCAFTDDRNAVVDSCFQGTTGGQSVGRHVLGACEVFRGLVRKDNSRMELWMNSMQRSLRDKTVMRIELVNTYAMIVFCRPRSCLRQAAKHEMQGEDAEQEPQNR